MVSDLLINSAISLLKICVFYRINIQIFIVLTNPLKFKFRKTTLDTRA
jgi:hypothetical protein